MNDQSPPENTQAVRVGANAERHLLEEYARGRRIFADTDLSHAKLRLAELPGAEFRRVNLRDADLGDSDLHETVFDQVNLSGANLRGADLSGTRMRDTDLSAATLESARLEQAHLVATNLKRAVLSHCCLIETRFEAVDGTDGIWHSADLRGAVIGDAVLDGVDLADSVMGDTIFVRIDLRRIVGLNAVEHVGPSTLGLDSLMASYGDVDCQFLRGCGLSDWEIEAAKLYRENLGPSECTDIAYGIVNLKTEKPIVHYSVFISYQHADRDFAKMLYSSLQERGIRCWLDEKQMRPGDDIYERIDAGIKGWDKLLLCLSKSTLKSWWVDMEINKAFAKERRLMTERGQKVNALIPLDLDGALWHATGGKTEELRSRVAADFRSREHFGDAVDSLVLALRADDRDRDLPPMARL